MKSSCCFLRLVSLRRLFLDLVVVFSIFSFLSYPETAVSNRDQYRNQNRNGRSLK